MPKQFYQFGLDTFREQLFENYVTPAAHWFLGEKSHAYLLPQISGSNWECALALEGLIEILANPDMSIADRTAEIEAKCIQTVRWLIGQISEPSDSMSNWDGVTWDTAICIRAILKAEKQFADVWSVSDKKKIAVTRQTSTRWLIYSCKHWDIDIRYPAGPPDLAQILHTLSILNAYHPEMIKELEAEAEIGSVNDEPTSIRIVRLLLAMRQPASITLSDGEIQTCFWVDCFNTSEVLEGLTSFLVSIEGTDDKSLIKIKRQIKESIFQGIQYLECNQVDGTWGGVADTCGALYGYLRVTTMMTDLDPKDHLVFQALRWMCDEKQAMADGSFLHTSYVTVFYFMAILEAYRDWELGKKGGVKFMTSPFGPHQFKLQLREVNDLDCN